jgi:hypothetical protein
MRYSKTPKFKPGDLVEVRSHVPSSRPPYEVVWSPAVIVNSRTSSMHVMDRPVKIVDVIEYQVIKSGLGERYKEEDIRVISP